MTLRFLEMRITTTDNKEHYVDGWYCEISNSGGLECYDIGIKDDIKKAECIDHLEWEIIITNRFTDFHALSEVLKWEVK
jgi:hypothetical protein